MLKKRVRSRRGVDDIPSLNTVEAIELRRDNLAQVLHGIALHAEMEEVLEEQRVAFVREVLECEVGDTVVSIQVSDENGEFEGERAHSDRQSSASTKSFSIKPWRAKNRRLSSL
jgi:hypothetical protein